MPKGLVCGIKNSFPKIFIEISLKMSCYYGHMSISVSYEITHYIPVNQYSDLV